MKKTLLITLLGLALLGCNDHSQHPDGKAPVSSQQQQHPERVYVSEHNYYEMETAVTNDNWVGDDNFTPMPGEFPKYHVPNTEEWPKEDITDKSSYDLPRFQFAWANDGDRYNLKIWSMKTDGTDLRLVVPDTHTDGIALIKRSPNLRYVAWVGRTSLKFVYDLQTGVKVQLRGGGKPGMVWSEDSRYLYFQTGGTIDNARWDSQTGKIEEVDIGIGPAAVIKDNQLITLNDGALMLMDLTSHEKQLIGFMGQMPDRDVIMRFRSISPDGDYAWGQNDKYNFFFDIQNNKVTKFTEDEDFVRAPILGANARFSATNRIARVYVVDREKQQLWQWYALGSGEIGVESNMSLYNGLANNGLWFKGIE